MVYGTKYLNPGLSTEETLTLRECFLAESSLGDLIVSEEILDEGANIDNTKVAIEAVKEIKGLMKEYNKLVKKEEYKAAKSKLAQVNKCLDKAEDTIRKNEGNIGSAFFGLFTGGLLGTVRMLPINFMNTVGVSLTKAGIQAISSGANFSAAMIVGSGICSASTILSTIKGFINLFNGIKVFIKDLDKGAKVSDILNGYRSQILAMLTQYRSMIKNMEKQLDKRLKA